MATLIKGLEDLFSTAKPAAGGRMVALGVRSRELIEQAFSQTQAASLEIVTHQKTGANGWEAAKVAQGKAVVKLTDLQGLAQLAVQGGVDLVLLYPHKDRELTYFWADCAMSMLKVGGFLAIVGPRNEGVEPLEKRAAEKLEKVTRAVVKPFGRGTLFKKTEPVSVPEIKRGGFEADGVRFQTLPGVFSKNHFDDGTAMLIDAAEVHAGERVLDLGCGPGTVGLTLLRREPSLRVVLTDEDANAIASVVANAEVLGLKPEDVFVADGATALKEGMFDVVVLNPPFHAGPAVDYAIAQNLAARAKEHMTPGARMFLVANAHCPYERFLESLFGSVEIVAGNASYKVWKCC